MSGQHNKIMVLHPMTKGLERKQTLFVGVDDVEVVSLSHGPATANSRMDHALSAAETVMKVREAEQSGCKAIVFTCYGDPELYALREAVRIPILGSMEIAMHFCAMLAHHFSILVPELWIKREQEDNAIKYGMESKIASIRIVWFGRPLTEVSELAVLRPVPEEVMKPTIQECINAIEEDDATAITFGCGCFTGMGDELQRRLKDKGFEVPIVNPLPLAVEVARVLIKLNLTQSILAYPLAKL